MAQTLGKADVEFYESMLVMKVARAIPGKPYASLLHRARQMRLDTAVSVVQKLLADDEVHARFSEIARLAAWQHDADDAVTQSEMKAAIIPR
jgi:hypothetical protein